MCVVGKPRQPHFKLGLEHWVMVPSLRQRTATATATRPHFHSTVESLDVLFSIVKTLGSNDSSLTINNFVARHPEKAVHAPLASQHRLHRCGMDSKNRQGNLLLTREGVTRTPPPFTLYIVPVLRRQLNLHQPRSFSALNPNLTLVSLGGRAIDSVVNMRFRMPTAVRGWEGSLTLSFDGATSAIDTSSKLSKAALARPGKPYRSFTCDQRHASRWKQNLHQLHPTSLRANLSLLFPPDKTRLPLPPSSSSG